MNSSSLSANPASPPQALVTESTSVGRGIQQAQKARPVKPPIKQTASEPSQAFLERQKKFLQGMAVLGSRMLMISNI